MVVPVYFWIGFFLLAVLTLAVAAAVVAGISYVLFLGVKGLVLLLLFYPRATLLGLVIYYLGGWLPYYPYTGYVNHFIPFMIINNTADLYFPYPDDYHYTWIFFPLFDVIIIFEATVIGGVGLVVVGGLLYMIYRALGLWWSDFTVWCRESQKSIMTNSRRLEQDIHHIIEMEEGRAE